MRPLSPVRNAAITSFLEETYFKYRIRSQQEGASMLIQGLFGKRRNRVDGRGLKGILGNFDL
jgi:hypothetical protein